MLASLEGGKSSVRGKIKELKFGQMSQTHINVTPIWIVTAAKNSKRLPKAAILFSSSYFAFAFTFTFLSFFFLGSSLQLS